MRSPLLISYAWPNAKEEKTVSNAAASRKRIVPIVFVTTLLL